MFARWRQCAPRLTHVSTAVYIPKGICVGSTIFGRPFVKRFALCYRTVVCPVLSNLSVICLSVTLVYCHYCGQTVGRIKMKLGTEVGLIPRHIVLDGDAAPPKGHCLPQFLAHVRCVQTAGWIKTPLGTEVGLGPGDIVLYGDPDPIERGTTALHNFRSMTIVAKRLDGLGCHLVWR